MDKFINLKLFNIPNFLLVLFSLTLAIFITHLFVTANSKGMN